MGKLISLSTMREVEIPHVSVGQGVKYTGDMANPAGIGAVISVRTLDPRTYDVALTDGRSMLGTYLDESRWQIMQTVLDAEQLSVLRACVEAKKATDEANKKAAKDEFEAAKICIKAENSHLIADGTRSYVQAAKNIRIELKRAFPGVKFSVRSESYSGGDSIDVSWTDGPQIPQVDAITSKYKGGSFDGMTDCYNYEKSPWTEIFGDAKYIHCHRTYSDKMVASVIQRVCNHLGGMDRIPAVEDYRQGRLFTFKQSGGCDVEREINVALAKHTYCITATN